MSSILYLRRGSRSSRSAFLLPKLERCSYDFYAGLDQAFDIRKPSGERAVRLRKLDKRPVSEEEEYTLVTTDLRAGGTGACKMIGESHLYRGRQHAGCAHPLHPKPSTKSAQAEPFRSIKGIWRLWGPKDLTLYDRCF